MKLDDMGFLLSQPIFESTRTFKILRSINITLFVILVINVLHFWSFVMLFTTFVNLLEEGGFLC